MSGAAFNRGVSRQDYQTPPDFMDAVGKGFGEIGFDLAADMHNHQSTLYYTKQTDSLSQPWHQLSGLLWLNPPFDNITPWAKKCADESEKGAKILFLTPASVGSNWFANHVFAKAQIYFLNGRLKFVGTKDPYPKDCMLASYGYGFKGINIWPWKKCSKP